MKMTFNAAFQKVILLENVTDQQKRLLITKIVQSIAEKQMTYTEISQILETCLTTALENNSNRSTALSLFAFASCGSKFPSFLKDYMNIDQITVTLEEIETIRLTIVLTWLKEGLQILNSDANYIANIGGSLSKVLEKKFLENGKHSAIVSQISEIYLLYPSLLPAQQSRLSFTVSIMHCVASFPTPTKPDTLKHMKNLGELVTVLWESLKLEDILTTLFAMYTIISNPDLTVEVCPAMAHILSLIFPQVVEGLGPRIVSHPQSSNDSFVATLVRLCGWLILWPTAHTTLVHWIRTLVRLLYQSGRNIVPARVAYEQVPKLLSEGLRVPVCRPGVLSVATILLMSFQYSAVAFHKVIEILIPIYECLEKESSESAKSTIEGLTKLCHAQMTLYPAYPEKYQNLVELLAKYPVPSEDELQTLIQEHNWVVSFKEGPGLLNVSKDLTKLLETSGADPPVVSYRKRDLGQKVGLRNLGNTCYMNSVLQALLMTDDFRHSVLLSRPKSNERLLVKLQNLFTSLCFSDRNFISPRGFHDASRPPWFSQGMQQDCSEYLRHLMSTLHEDERLGQKLPEYQERIIIESSLSDQDSVDSPSNQSCLQPVLNSEDSSSFGSSPATDNTEVAISDISSKDSSNDCTLETDVSEIQDLPDSDNECFLSSNVETELKYPSNAKDLKDFKNWRSVKSESPESSNDYESLQPDLIEDSNGSMKRKLNQSSPLKFMSNASKSPKNETAILSTEGDNSSDSGISGDLVEESDTIKGDLVESETIEDDIENMNSRDELLSFKNKHFISQVHKAFGGKISTSIQCLKCKTKSVHKDVFTDINLAFQDVEQCNAPSAIRKQPERWCNRKTNGTAPNLKIEDMIANYLTTERLTGENQYECARCKGKQDAERSIQILEGPEHLILTQLRFYYDTSKNQRQKVFTNVQFTEELFLPNSKSVQSEQMTESLSSESVIQSPEESSNLGELETVSPGKTNGQCSTTSYDKYVLYGVVVHSGYSSEGGHYYCFARNSSFAAYLQGRTERSDGEADSWFNFNDERVTTTSFCDISRLSQTFSRDTAYLLFYRKISPDVSPTKMTMPIVLEDVSLLSPELRQAIERDNMEYQREQDAESVRRRGTRGTSSGGWTPRKDDEDDPAGPGPPSSGPCGPGNSFTQSSREVF